jgi:hypothetical protein
VRSTLRTAPLSWSVTRTAAPVITEAGNDPKVAGLVYITAFALDKGKSVSSLLKDRSWYQNHEDFVFETNRFLDASDGIASIVTSPAAD